MSASPLTKTELRKRLDELARLNRYLPALQLKKKQLKLELDKTREEKRRITARRDALMNEARPWVGLLAENVNLEELFPPGEIKLSRDIIAGMELPSFRGVEFPRPEYDLFEYPPWVDAAGVLLKQSRELESSFVVLSARLKILEAEFLRTSQRVNLFEKIRIPEAREAVRRINIHLADRRTAEFGWALLAKRKQRRRGN